MIYYITAKSPIGDEWVMETHDTAEQATQALEKYRKEGAPDMEYRIDTVEQNVMGLMAEAARKWSATIPTMTHPFTAKELFPPGNGVTTSDCIECGAYVRITMQNRHAAWHNKVADL